MVYSRQLKHNLVIIAILLLAFALRVIAIDRIPAGLSHDEAYNGIAAMQVLAGDYRIFFEINKGIEPLIIYLEALAFNFFGIGPVQLRLVNVFAGMLTVALVYPFTARLFNRRIALLAMTAIAIAFWPLFVSRLTLRAVLLPPLLLLTLYFFRLALQPKSQFTLPFFALSGFFAGITMYTYLSSRFVPFILLTLFGYQLLCRKISKLHWAGLLLLFLVLGGIFAPLASYYWQNAESFTRRSNQVTTIPHALNGEFEPMLRNTLLTLGMFTFQGDTTDRYNLDGRPVFYWVNGLFFYVGLGLAVWRLVRSPKNAAPSVLLLSTTFFMLMSDFITDDSPHFLRTVGAVPVVYIFWALGVESVVWGLGRWATRQGMQTRQIFHPLFLITLLVFLTTLSTVVDYFSRWSTSSNARHIYGADIAEIARYLNASENEDLPAISAEYYRDLDRFRLDLHYGGKSPFAIWFDGRQTLAFPPPESGLSPRYIFPNSASPPPVWTSLLNAQPEESGQEYKLYRLPNESPLTRLQEKIVPVGVTVNNDLVLKGYHLLDDVVTGKQFKMLLVWQALRALPPGTDYTFLVQMRDAQGHLWYQTDGNGYDPGDWQPGIVGVQLLTFRLPGDLPPLTYHLTAQIVNRKTGQPLPVTGDNFQILLRTVTARLAETPRDIDPARLPNPVSQRDAMNIDNTGLLLRGYKIDQRNLPIGTNLALTLHWQAVQQPPKNYHLQFFLVDNAQQDIYRWPSVPPLGGKWPTKNWPAGYWVQNKLTLPVSKNLPVGTYILKGRWVTAEAGESMDKMDDSFVFGTVKFKGEE